MSSFVHSYYIIYDIIVNIFYQSIIFFLARWVNKANVGNWHELQLIGNTKAGSTGNPEYKRQGDIVYLQNVVLWTAAVPLPAHFATLPEGFRPSSQKSFTVNIRGVTSFVTGSINIDTEGLCTYSANSLGQTSTSINHGPDLSTVSFMI